MKFDLSITISVIIGLAAVVSPILTALINNHHQIKMKKLELKQEHFEKTVIFQRTIFENYIRTVGRCIEYNDGKSLQAYHENYFLALMYAPEKNKLQMQEINTYISKAELSLANKKMEQLIPDLQEYMKLL